MIDVKFYIKCLSDRVICLAIDYLDLVLSRNKIHKSRLFLVGVTCIVLASKVLSVQTYGLQVYIDVCHKIYNEKQIAHMEINIVKSLNYHLYRATTYTFL